MFGSSQKFVEQKLLKDANFPSVYVYVYWQAANGKKSRNLKFVFTASYQA